MLQSKAAVYGDTAMHSSEYISGEFPFMCFDMISYVPDIDYRAPLERFIARRMESKATDDVDDNKDGKKPGCGQKEAEEEKEWNR